MEKGSYLEQFETQTGLIVRAFHPTGVTKVKSKNGTMNELCAQFGVGVSEKYYHDSYLRAYAEYLSKRFHKVLLLFTKSFDCYNQKTTKKLNYPILEPYYNNRRTIESIAQINRLLSPDFPENVAMIPWEFLDFVEDPEIIRAHVDLKPGAYIQYYQEVLAKVPATQIYEIIRRVNPRLLSIIQLQEKGLKEPILEILFQIFESLRKKISLFGKIETKFTNKADYICDVINRAIMYIINSATENQRFEEKDKTEFQQTYIESIFEFLELCIKLTILQKTNMECILDDHMIKLFDRNARIFEYSRNELSTDLYLYFQGVPALNHYKINDPQIRAIQGVPEILTRFDRLFWSKDSIQVKVGHKKEIPFNEQLISYFEEHYTKHISGFRKGGFGTLTLKILEGQ